MKKIFLIFLFPFVLNAQSDLLLLMDGVSYDKDAKTYFDVATTLSKDRKTIINTFVKMLKDSLGITSLSSKFDVMYLLANEDSVSSKLNLVKRAHDGVNIGATFVADQGWSGADAGDYIDTKYIASTQGVTYTLNSASITGYSRTNATGATDIGSVGTYNSTLTIRNSSNQIWARINTGGFGVKNSITDSRGSTIASRTASNATNVYKNGVIVGTESTDASNGVATSNMTILAVSTGFSGKQLAFVAIGGGLTATEARQLSNCIEWYMDAIGAGVIP